jgi:DNA-binding MarR family transcriptional regulator
MQLCFHHHMSEPWTPDCVEDDLLVAFASVKRGFQGASLAGDPGRFPILHHLAVAGASRQGPLAEAIGLDASTVSRHVRALLEDGLVVAERDPDDGRATVLDISDSGRQFLAAHLIRSRQTLQAATASFTDAERVELVRLLQKLAAALADMKEST